MKNWTKRILTLLFAASLLLSCAAAFSGCNKTDPTKETYSYEFYENALRQICINDPGSLLWSFGFTGIPDGMSLRYFGLQIVGPSDKNRNKIQYNLYLDYRKEIKGGRRFWLYDAVIADEQYFDDLKDSLPEEAVELDDENSNQPCLRVDFTKLSEEDKARLCKIFFDSYIKQCPEALELVSLEE